MHIVEGVLCAVSGLMACIAEPFDVTDDGCGSVLQTSSASPG